MASKLVSEEATDRKEEKESPSPSAAAKIVSSSSSAYSSTFKKRTAKDAPRDEHVSAAGNPTSCHFCGTLDRILSSCSRCDVAYCGIKCFKCEAHAACLEDFYRRCVEEDLQRKQAEQMDARPVPETFEKTMKAHLAKPETVEKMMRELLAGKRATMPGTDDAGEPLYDSDDEDPSAKGKGEEAKKAIAKKAKKKGSRCQTVGKSTAMATLKSGTRDKSGTLKSGTTGRVSRPVHRATMWTFSRALMATKRKVKRNAAKAADEQKNSLVLKECVMTASLVVTWLVIYKYYRAYQSEGPSPSLGIDFYSTMAMSIISLFEYFGLFFYPRFSLVELEKKLWTRYRAVIWLIILSMILTFGAFCWAFAYAYFHPSPHVVPLEVQELQAKMKRLTKFVENLSYTCRPLVVSDLKSLTGTGVVNDNEKL